MANYLLKETLDLFASSDLRNLDLAMQRGLCNDTDRLFDRIHYELNALPPEYREMIIKKYVELLENEIRRIKILKPGKRPEQVYIVDLKEIVGEGFVRTNENMFFLKSRMKRAIIEAKIEHSLEEVRMKYLEGDDIDSRIINALAHSIMSNWEK